VSLTLAVRVTPRAWADEVIGWSARGLEVRLRAAPADGEANAALVALLAGVLEVRKADVTIRTGHAARLKRLEIAGDKAVLESRLMTHYAPRHDG